MVGEPLKTKKRRFSKFEIYFTVFTKTEIPFSPYYNQSINGFSPRIQYTFHILAVAYLGFCLEEGEGMYSSRGHQRCILKGTTIVLH